jgi:uncharacterized protein (DUF488 family)
MIYTIGYSDRSLPQFLYELELRGITRIIDVRSSPWSRNAAFNAPQIEQWAERAGIHYRQEGAILGGRTETRLDHPDYLSALDRLLDAACREPLVIMCAEGRPEDCHRTWDVGAGLLVRHGAVARSILRDGSEEDITDTIRRVPASRFAPEMHEMINAQSRLF